MTLNFCTACGAKLTANNLTEYVCANGHLYWNNPRACVAIILLQGDMVLVSKRAHEPNPGMYDLPGGFIDYGESAETAAIREMLEETTLEVSELELIKTYPGIYQENESLCELLFVCHRWQGTITAQDDSEALEWVPIEFLNDEQFVPNYPGLVDYIRSPYTDS